MTDYEKIYQSADQRLQRALADGERTWTHGRELLFALHKAGLLPSWPNLTRVVLDIRADSIVKMYVEEILSSKILQVGLTADGIQIEILPRGDEPQ